MSLIVRPKDGTIRKKNTGKWLQDEIDAIAKDYQRRGILTLKKVDPPTRVIPGPRPKVIMLENPFLDFIGTWTERQGRCLVLEAKSTEEPKLTICNSGGLSERQWNALHAWETAGAVTGVLWGYREAEIRFVPMAALRAQWRSEAKHIKWENATPIPRGTGFCTWDFAAVLRQYFPH